ncbi:MAG: hypothetical protein Q9200_005184, partial [Gallowayella weberi]
MGKSKKQKTHTRSSHPHPYHHNPSTSTTTTKNPPGRLPTKQQHTTNQNPHPRPPTIIPFHPSNRILLVGEGDFSFTHSLYTTHNCTSLTATSHDSAAALAEKYPQSSRYIRELLAATTTTGCADEEEEEDEEDEEDDNDMMKKKKKKKEIKILYGVDATKLGKATGSGSGGKVVRK